MVASSKISGNQSRKMKSMSRLYAVQALFQMEHSSVSVDKVCEEFLKFRFGDYDHDLRFIDGNQELFKNLVSNAVKFQAAIDQMTDRALVEKWPIDRIDPTLRALFRVAGAEMKGLDTPSKVIISEYLTISEAFYPDGKETKFVNAVLDFMARDSNPNDF